MTVFDDVPRLRDLDVRGRRVFLRVDLGLPLSPHGAVLDDTRLREALPTIRGLLAQEAKVVIAGSYGPAGTTADSGASKGIASRLGELLGAEVGLLGERFWRDVASLHNAQIALAPDLADIPEEATNDPAFADRIARGFDVYVNDALRGSTEATASVDAVPRRMVSRGVGLQVDLAIRALKDFVEVPTKPFAAAIGGRSVVRREALLRSLLATADTLVLGGVVANTFLVARAWSPGASVYEAAGVPLALEILREAAALGVAVMLPVDAVVATRSRPDASPVYSVKKIADVGAEDAVADIAIETSLAYREVMTSSATVLWNGLMGDCSNDQTQSGSYRTAQAATEASRYTMLVGDRTLAAARFFQLADYFRFEATGGDAMLALLRGDVLPGLEALRT